MLERIDEDAEQQTDGSADHTDDMENDEVVGAGSSPEKAFAQIGLESAEMVEAAEDVNLSPEDSQN